MNCKDFQHWLCARQHHKKTSLPDTVLNHLKICSECKQLYTLDTGLDKTIETAFELQAPPNGLHERIELTIDHASPPEKFSWKKITAVAVVFSFISILVFSLFFNQPFTYRNLHQLSEAAVTSHLKANTAMSFSAQNIETAITMLSRELKFNVIIPDLKNQGYILLGGRLCALGKCKIAYLFYKKENKISSLIIMDDNHLDFQLADGSRFNSTVKGLRSDVWKENGQVYAMVY